MDLSLPAVIKEILAGSEGWNAVAFFCHSVMVQKEEDERRRKEDPKVPPEKKGAAICINTNNVSPPSSLPQKIREHSKRRLR